MKRFKKVQEINKELEKSDNKIQEELDELTEKSTYTDRDARHMDELRGIRKELSKRIEGSIKDELYIDKQLAAYFVGDELYLASAILSVQQSLDLAMWVTCMLEEV